MQIPFTQLHITTQELGYIYQAMTSGHITGDGSFTKKCQRWLEESLGGKKALLTHSCTAALEMSAILADIQPGDEVIMPSFTFVSTANAVVLRGGVPVFVDIRPDTLNLDETKIEAAITAKTKAIMSVHYAGVACEMDAIANIAKAHNLVVIEDAAQGLVASYKNRPIGSLGNLAAFSFHATKNVVSGEGGALIINDPSLIERAEIIWEKGTNRSKFFRGEVDKYTWVDIGSSYLPSDLIAAFLWAQLQSADQITHQRMKLWQRYHHAFADLEQNQIVRRPQIPAHCQHNAHIYHLLTASLDTRTELLARLKAAGIQATFHYVPLHSSPAGQRFGKVSGSMAVTDDLSDRLVRLPLSSSLSMQQIDHVIAITRDVLGAKSLLTEAC
jgi:dTDP-4-amino-4,6-dideoxygalactose transaminase